MGTLEFHVSDQSDMQPWPPFASVLVLGLQERVPVYTDCISFRYVLPRPCASQNHIERYPLGTAYVLSVGRGSRKEPILNLLGAA